jgi:hypothetical protein
MGRRNPATEVTPDTIAQAEKQRDALELRKAGATYDQIAKTLGYADRSGAQRLVRDAFARITRETSEEVLTLELERLDAMLLALWPKAKKGEAHSVDRVLRIMERRSRYQGLDAPAPVQVTGDMTVRYEVVGLTPEVLT